MYVGCVVGWGSQPAATKRGRGHDTATSVKGGPDLLMQAKGGISRMLAHESHHVCEGGGGIGISVWGKRGEPPPPSLLHPSPRRFLLDPLPNAAHWAF